MGPDQQQGLGGDLLGWGLTESTLIHYNPLSMHQPIPGRRPPCNATLMQDDSFTMLFYFDTVLDYFITDFGITFEISDELMPLDLYR